MSVDMLRAVFAGSRSRGADRLVLLALADRADTHGVSWPGLDDIARRARVHRATVCRSLVRLKSLGELRVERGGGRGCSNRYHILLPETVAARHP